MLQNLGILALFTFVYSLAARRLDKTPINGALVYVAFGFLCGPLVLGILQLSIGTEGIRLLAELTLALVLFIDASNADLGVLRRAVKIPGRMLAVGLPITIVFGIGVGMLLFPELGFFEIAILATMLSPTDAALGKAVVTNEAVPAPVREGLNVESGLNDGICVPILFTFLACATHPESGGGLSIALGFVAQEVGIGLVIGVGLSALGALGLRAIADHGGVAHAWSAVPIAALAFACFTLTQFAHGSGFIACFVGGLVFGHMARDHKEELLVGAEGAGETFSLLTWVVFGAAVLGGQHAGFVDWRVIVYSLFALTVMRMLPTALSLVGIGVSVPAKLFLGWFGPRGLASIVFIVIVSHEKLPGNPILVGSVVTTVLFSVIAHGLSANPLAQRFGASEARAAGEGA